MVDTNVLFEGLTRQGDSAVLVNAWVSGRFLPCVSLALALEYEEVLGNKLGPGKRRLAMPALQALLARAEFVPILYSVRPMSPDPDDDFVIDCAFNAGAQIVTHNLKDFRGAEEALGIGVVSPTEFIARLGSP